MLILTGCTSVEIAKEITKISKTIENSFKKVSDSKEEVEEEKPPEENLVRLTPEEDLVQLTPEENQKIAISIEKKQITEDKQRISEVVSKQIKVANFNLMGKTFDELSHLIGRPQLVRKDRQTITARYDSINCRVFVFMNLSANKKIVEYYELRNDVGELIDHQKDIEKCFKEIKPT
jgi:hypothetical protein